MDCSVESMQPAECRWWAMSGNKDGIFLTVDDAYDILLATVCMQQQQQLSTATCRCRQRRHTQLFACTFQRLWHGDVVAAVQQRCSTWPPGTSCQGKQD